jgi:ankyrin repeat protein
MTCEGGRGKGEGGARHPACARLMSRTSALHVAAGSNNLAVLDEVLRLPPVEQNAALTSRDGGNNTPLHIASYKGNLLFVQKILSSCSLAHYSVDLPNLVNDNGNSPLHLAVLGNHRPVVQALLAASPPSDFNLKDKQGYTPIHYACGEGYLDVAQVCDANRRARSGSQSHAHVTCRSCTRRAPPST